MWSLGAIHTQSPMTARLCVINMTSQPQVTVCPNSHDETMKRKTVFASQLRQGQHHQLGKAGTPLQVDERGCYWYGPVALAGACSWSGVPAAGWVHISYCLVGLNRQHMDMGSAAMLGES